MREIIIHPARFSSAYSVYSVCQRCWFCISDHGDLGDPPPSPVNPEFKGLSRFNPGVNPLCRFVFVHVDWRLTFFRPLLPPFLRVSRFWVCSSDPQGFRRSWVPRSTPKTKDLSFVTPALFA